MLRLFRVNYMQDAVNVETEAHLVSYSRRIQSTISLLDFLRTASPTQPRVYWENTQLDMAYAGYGVAAELFANDTNRFETIRRETQSLFSRAVMDFTQPAAAPRLFGGFAFRTDYQPEGIWQKFPSAYFILPRYQLTRVGDETWLTVNACVSSEREHTQIRAEADLLVKRFENPDHARPTLTVTLVDQPEISYPLERSLWHKQITDATQRMKAGELDKVVLSRTCDVRFDSTVDPLNALERLQSRYPDTYRFMIEPTAGNAFFGATPELLVALNGQHLETGALAGSIKRGTTAEEDDTLAAQLFTNPKERHEHRLVVDSLENLLLPITRKLNVPDEPQIRKLSNIQHLHTPMTGELNGDYSVLDVVERLHPTPALGGYPRQIAIETINMVEPISRGWYGAPVGWLDANGNGMFAVAIRSAVSSGQQARLYAGVGVVADSDPDREWDETRLKFRPMLDALGVKQ